MRSLRHPPSTRETGKQRRRRRERMGMDLQNPEETSDNGQRVWRKSCGGKKNAPLLGPRVIKKGRNARRRRRRPIPQTQLAHSRWCPLANRTSSQSVLHKARVIFVGIIPMCAPRVPLGARAGDLVRWRESCGTSRCRCATLAVGQLRGRVRPRLTLPEPRATSTGVGKYLLPRPWLCGGMRGHVAHRRSHGRHLLGPRSVQRHGVRRCVQLPCCFPNASVVPQVRRRAADKARAVYVEQVAAGARHAPAASQPLQAPLAQEGTFMTGRRWAPCSAPSHIRPAARRSIFFWHLLRGRCDGHIGRRAGWCTPSTPMTKEWCGKVGLGQKLDLWSLVCYPGCELGDVRLSKMAIRGAPFWPATRRSRPRQPLWRGMAGVDNAWDQYFSVGATSFLADAQSAPPSLYATDAAACEFPQRSAACEFPQRSAACEFGQRSAACEFPQHSAACELPQHSAACEFPQRSAACECLQRSAA
eukprot:gene20597-biopygen4095